MFDCAISNVDVVYLKQKGADFQFSTRTSGVSARHLKMSVVLKIHEILVQIELVRFSYITLLSRYLCLRIEIKTLPRAVLALHTKNDPWKID